jgi:hypothetical protein|tara:strand:+ start:42 stop:572 length:531 start_codon:yes stop_codon:yes gene_type:complete
MANVKLTDKTALEEQLGSGDLFMVVDANDTTSSSAGTSKKFDTKFLLQTDKISVTNSEVVNLHSTPRTLVGALSGYMITVYNVTVLCTYALSTEASSNDLYFGYDDSSNSYYWKYLRDFMNLKTDNLSYSLQADTAAGGTFNASIINKPFIMWSNAAFTGGWSAEVYVTYAYTKIL